MHMHFAEVAPLAPLLVPLSEIAACLFIIALCAVVKTFAEALFGGVSAGLGWIPWLGSKVQGPIHTIEHKITSTLGAVEQKMDARIGMAWHQAARIIDWTGREIRSHANLLWTLATVLTGTAGAGQLARAIGNLFTHVKGVGATANAAVARVTTLERRLQHQLTATVLPRLRWATHELDVVIPRDVAGLRARTKTVEGELARAWQAIRRNEAALAGTAIVGVVALALSRLGLSWARCSNVNKVGRGICGMNPALLDSLLIGSLALSGGFSIVALAEECQRFAPTVTAGVDWVVTELH